LLGYVKKNFFKDDEEKAEWLCEDIHGLCEFGVDMQTILDAFNDRDISFKDMNQANEVIQLVMGVANNIRIWENNGYTPNEIFEKFEKPNLKPLPDKPFVVKKKVGRNDPCLNIPTQKCTLTGRFEHSVRLTSARYPDRVQFIS